MSANSKDHADLIPGYNVYSERNCVFASFRWIIETTYNCSLFRFHKMGNVLVKVLIRAAAKLVYALKGNMSACYPEVMIDGYTPALAHKIKERTIGILVVVGFTNKSKL